MQEHLRQHHQNRKREGTEMEKLLGTNTAVIAFAQFFEAHMDDMELISAVRLNEFVSDPKADFTSRDIDFYKKGLAELPKVLSMCYNEIEQEKEKERLKS